MKILPKEKIKYYDEWVKFKLPKGECVGLDPMLFSGSN